MFPNNNPPSSQYPQPRAQQSYHTEQQRQVLSQVTASNTDRRIPYNLSLSDPGNLQSNLGLYSNGSLGGIQSNSTLLTADVNSLTPAIDCRSQMLLGIQNDGRRQQSSVCTSVVQPSSSSTNYGVFQIQPTRPSSVPLVAGLPVSTHFINQQGNSSVSDTWYQTATSSSMVTHFSPAFVGGQNNHPMRNMYQLQSGFSRPLPLVTRPEFRTEQGSQSSLYPTSVTETVTVPIQSQQIDQWSNVPRPLVAHSPQFRELQAGRNVSISQSSVETAKKDVQYTPQLYLPQSGEPRVGKNIPLSECLEKPVEKNTSSQQSLLVKQYGMLPVNMETITPSDSNSQTSKTTRDKQEFLPESKDSSSITNNDIKNEREEASFSKRKKTTDTDVIMEENVSKSGLVMPNISVSSHVPSAEKYCEILETQKKIAKVSKKKRLKQPEHSSSVKKVQNMKEASSLTVIKQETKDESGHKATTDLPPASVGHSVLQELIKVKKEKCSGTPGDSCSPNMFGQLNPPTQNCTGLEDEKKALSHTIVDASIFDEKMSFSFQVEMLSIVTAIGANYVLQTKEEAIKLDLMCYWCNFCAFTTENQDALKLHIREHRFRCQVCEYEAFTRAEVVCHSVKNHSNFVDSASLLKYSYLLSDYLDIEKKKFKLAEKRKLCAADTTEPCAKRLKTEETSHMGISIKNLSNDELMETEWKTTDPTIEMKELHTKYTQTDKSFETRSSDMVVHVNSNATSPKSTEDKTASPKRKGHVVIGSMSSLSPKFHKGEENQKIQSYLNQLQLQIPRVQLQRLSMSGQSSDTKTSSPQKLIKNTTDAKIFNKNASFPLSPPDPQSFKLHPANKVCQPSTDYDQITLSKPLSTNEAANKADKTNFVKNPSSRPSNPILPSVPTTPSTFTSDMCFRCGHCGFSCSQQKQLEVHMRSIHSSVSNPNLPPSGVKKKKDATSSSAEDEIFVNDEDGNRNYKCALCSFTNNSTMQVKSHLTSTHRGSVFYCIDMVSVEEQKRQYVFFCHKPNCSFKTKGSQQYIEHTETCTAFLYTKDLKEEDMHLKKSLDFTLSFAKRVALQPQFIPLSTSRTSPAKYVCMHCAYSSDNNTRVKKHIISNHTQKPSVMRDEHADKSRQSIYFCKHCMWETRDKSKLKPHLIDRHNDDGKDVSDSEWDQSNTTIISTTSDKLHNVKATESSSPSNASKKISKISNNDTDEDSAGPAKEKVGRPWKTLESGSVKARKEKTQSVHTSKPAKNKIGSKSDQKKTKEKPKAISPKSSGSLIKTLPSSSAVSFETEDEDLPLYRCPSCGVLTYNEECIKRHMTSLHNSQVLIAINVYRKQCDEKEPVSYFCPENCSFSANVAGQFFAHAIKCHKFLTNHSYMVALRNFVKEEHERKKIITFANQFPESYECLFCSTSVITKSVLKMKRHFKYKHPDEDIIFRDGFSWKLHRKARTYMCNKRSCDFITADQKEIELHKLAHNHTHIYECEKCTYFTTVLDDLPTHNLDSHEGENIFGLNEFYVTLDKHASIVKKKIE